MRYPFVFTSSMKVLLEDLGFVKTSHPASWEDVGNAENGSKVSEHPEYDTWMLGHQAVIVSEGNVQSVDQEQPEEDIPFHISEKKQYL